MKRVFFYKKVVLAVVLFIIIFFVFDASAVSAKDTETRRQRIINLCQENENLAKELKNLIGQQIDEIWEKVEGLRKSLKDAEFVHELSGRAAQALSSFNEGEKALDTLNPMLLNLELLRDASSKNLKIARNFYRLARFRAIRESSLIPFFFSLRCLAELGSFESEYPSWEAQLIADQKILRRKISNLKIVLPKN